MFTRRTAITGGLAVPLAPTRFVPEMLPWATRLVAAARRQIGVTRLYDPSYVRLDYPMGDVPRDRGVCTDVVVRAYRDAFSVDLQRRIHEDMTSNFGSYPSLWGLTRPDANIDHRRVPNLECYFSRWGESLAIPNTVSGWLAGDIYTMRYKGSLPHIGIVSDRATRSGRPYILHNLGWGTSEDDIIGKFRHEKRFRFIPEPSV